MEEDKIEKLANLIKTKNKIVFFGGAGVSTESGIPDFRSAKGLYNQKYNNLSPEKIISHSFFESDPKMFYDYYKEHLVFNLAKPNKAHYALRKLEMNNKLLAIVTQNIDGLHQMAGSKNVYEIHGTIHKNTCLKCQKKYSLSQIISSKGVPYCECSGIIKPDVVLYEESLPDDAIRKSIEAISQADLLIVAGTSLNVYPAASFIDYYQGKDLVIINLSKTYADNYASLVINDKVGEVLEKVIEKLNF